MAIARLDQYTYDIHDTYANQNRDVAESTYVSIEFDTEVDPKIYDIYNKLYDCDKVHLDGRYFDIKSYEIKHRIGGGVYLDIRLQEDKKQKRGAI